MEEYRNLDLEKKLGAVIDEINDAGVGVGPFLTEAEKKDIYYESETHAENQKPYNHENMKRAIARFAQKIAPFLKAN